MAAEKGLTMEILAEKGELEKLLNEAEATGVKGCFCAYDDKPSPEGCDLCNPSPTDPDNTDNLFHGYAIGTLKEHRPAIDQIRERYTQQIRQKEWSRMLVYLARRSVGGSFVDQYEYELLREVVEWRGKDT